MPAVIRGSGTRQAGPLSAIDGETLKRIPFPDGLMGPKAPFEVTAMGTRAGIRLRGEVDITTLPALEAALEGVVSRAADATVDLSELTFIDVCGLRALARAAIRLRMTGRCLRLRGTGTRTRRLLSLLGWAELFEMAC